VLYGTPSPLRPVGGSWGGDLRLNDPTGRFCYSISLTSFLNQIYFQLEVPPAQLARMRPRQAIEYIKYFSRALMGPAVIVTTLDPRA
jgi:hypothetical protein